jgi:hypothetical protein
MAAGVFEFSALLDAIFRMLIITSAVLAGTSMTLLTSQSEYIAFFVSSALDPLGGSNLSRFLRTISRSCQVVRR